MARLANPFGRDNTGQNGADDALRRSEARFAIAEQAAGAGTWDWDVSSGKIEWSAGMFVLFGLDQKKDAASFDSWNRILHPDDLDAANRKIMLALEQKTSLDNEYRIMRPDGEVRWINALGEGVYDKEGRPVRMSGICIDITRRRVAEAAIRESEEKYRTTLDSISDGFFSCDETWHFVYVNAQAERKGRTGRRAAKGD